MLLVKKAILTNNLDIIALEAIGGRHQGVEQGIIKHRRGKNAHSPRTHQDQHFTVL